MAKDRLERGLRATFLGIAVNVVLGAAKFAAGIFGHSHALIADATESFADIFNSLVVWRGIVVAAAPPDENHPYGHSKAEPLAGAFGAVMLFAAAIWIAANGTWDIYQLLNPQIFHYHHEPLRWFTLVVLVVVIVVKEGLFRFVVGEGEATDNSAVKTDAWHHRSDAITSAGAFIGISIALIGGEKFSWADDAAAIFCAIIIGINGWLLLRPPLSELMDEAPDPKIVERIRQIAAGASGVERVEKCFVRKAGHLFFVEMHVEVNPQMTVLRSHEIAHDVKDKIRETMPEVSDVLVHIEPLNIPARKN
ncbi:MAG TPA: cation diffusion facilitator family transporter [Verrucomicrobiae bacterium]